MTTVSPGGRRPTFHATAAGVAVAVIALVLSVGLTVVRSPGAAAAPASSDRSASHASRYAPLNRPGPRLSVPRKLLQRSLRCHGSLSGRRGWHGEPVLLNPATGVTPQQNYSWNYERAFNAQHRAWCAVTMPDRTLGDIQIAGEYLVHAIRSMHHRAGRRIAVLGHSQGGMSMRWALRFWPDTRPMVDDVIGMAGSNHGTTVLRQCVVGATRCPAADWQQGAHAKFIRALNSRTETFRHISYTEVYTHTDEVVQPNGSDGAPASSALTPGPNVTNVATQDVCAADPYEHLTVGTVDPVTYALVMDALNHRGPARPQRLGTGVCRRLYQPGVDPARAQTYLQTLAAAPGLLQVTIPAPITGVRLVPAEPRLRCYTRRAGC